MSIFGEKKPAIYPTSGSVNISAFGGGGGATETSFDTASAHSLSAGDGVLIQGVTGATSSINGSHKVKRVTDADTFVIDHYLTGTPASGNITKGIYLTYSQIKYNFIEPDQLNYRSVINGNRTNTHLGDYGTFKVTVFLWRAGTIALTKSLMSAIYAYYHTNVIFCPNQLPIKDSSSNLVYCYLKEFRPFYYKNLRDYDAVELTFEINKYHDISKLLL